ncbi:MAG: polyphosphate kinase 1 [Fibrobacteria bacterium]
MSPEPNKHPRSQARYIDRDFSWLTFNRRVLAEARSAENPLLERLKFLSIVANNLDEFFEVRVAGLLQKVESAVPVDGIAGLDCREKLTGLLRIVHAMVAHQYRCWNDELIPELGAQGIKVLGLADLGPAEREELQRRFHKEIFPLLTPIKVDPAHPFPWVLNKALCLGVWLEEEIPGKRGGLGVVAIPRCLPRVMELPSQGGDHRFVFIYDVIKLFMGELFRGYRIKGQASFRVTRNSNLYMTEDASNLLDTVEEVVHNRRKGNVVRLEIDEDTPARIRIALMDNFDLEPELVFSAPGPVNLNRLMGLYQMAAFPALKFPPHSPRHLAAATGTPDPRDVFARLRERDLLLHHPFDSYDPVIDFIRAAALDPDVLCIKQTLYRTSAESPVMYALLEAAELGKEVTAVVELQARFDEKSNINWARQLQDSGGTVVYGLVGLKTHCKLSLVLRREGTGTDSRIREYAHIGTGNYHPGTARLYTDLSLFTADRNLTEGISGVFNFLTSHAKSPAFPNLLVGPVNFLDETLRLIGREEANARAGRPSGIFAKMNALIDPDIIEALYQASGAGVPIRLMVRGICSLRPGVEGLSETIQVRSVVARFLEHSRIFRFENQGEPVVFMGSGDWMTRNLRERVEVLIPVFDADLRGRLEEILDIYWADNAKAHFMTQGGSYIRMKPEAGEARFDAQAFLMDNPQGGSFPRKETHARALPEASREPSAHGQLLNK